MAAERWNGANCKLGSDRGQGDWTATSVDLRLSAKRGVRVLAGAGRGAVCGRSTSMANRQAPSRFCWARGACRKVVTGCHRWNEPESRSAGWPHCPRARDLPRAGREPQGGELAMGARAEQARCRPAARCVKERRSRVGPVLNVRGCCRQSRAEVAASRARRTGSPGRIATPGGRIRLAQQQRAAAGGRGGPWSRAASTPDRARTRARRLRRLT